MDINEAIKHSNEIADSLGDCKCAAEHRQIAIWLQQLVEYKQLIERVKNMSSGRLRNVQKLVEMIGEQENIIEIQKQTMFYNNTRAQEIVSELRLKIDEIKDTDRLAELEEQILKYYLAKGYKLLSEQDECDPSWHFEVQIKTWHKKKAVNVVLFISTIPIAKDSYFGDALCETTKEMFDKAFEFFSTKKNLCDSCTFYSNFPYCPSTDKKFGDGIGNDNIFSCDEYRKESKQ